MILAQTSVESAAIEALKSSPGYIVALVLVVLFLRYLSEQRKSDSEERKETRASLDRNTEACNRVAVVMEGLKEKIQK